MNDPLAGADRRLAVAEARLLAPAMLDAARLEGALGRLASGGADFADLYFEAVENESWTLEDGHISAGDFSIDEGVGARAVVDGQTAFSYANELSRAGLQAAGDAVGVIACFGPTGEARAVQALRSAAPKLTPYDALDPTAGGQAADRVAFLQTLDARTRAVDPAIVKVTATLRLQHKVVLVAATHGALSADVRPLVRIQLSVIAERGGRRRRGGAASGGRYDLGGLDETVIADLVARATSIALTALDARPAPAGEMPVVLGPGFPGVLLHEAVGHGLEADAHRKRTSVFTGRFGEQIAAPGVNVVDDATVPTSPGSLIVDDEGIPAGATTLIQDGRLVGMLQDQLNARMTNAATTGNGRRQSYAHTPMPRMTNTFLVAGDYDPGEIIASVRHGVYANAFSGGQVDITSGRFTFSAVQAWLIEDGRLTAPLAGAVLLGEGHEALRRMDMIGADLKLDDGEAVCGKQGQSVLVGVGQPTVRLNRMLVGGEA